MLVAEGDLVSDDDGHDILQGAMRVDHYLVDILVNGLFLVELSQTHLINKCLITSVMITRVECDDGQSTGIGME